jgi:Holliday junction resolvasome RuvABC DNA-binding subunit
MSKKITEEQISLHLQTLKSTPERIAAAIKESDETRLQTPFVLGEWSAVQILAHLRGCAEVWSYTIYAMLILDTSELAHIHPRDWVKKLGYEKLSFEENFTAFKVERNNLIRMLEKLTFEDWRRSASFIGRANTQTIFSQTMRMALHELDHCKQLEAMFAAA